MNIRKSTLWRVPMYCIIAGKISFHLIIYLISKFAVIKTPNDTGTIEVTIDDTRVLLLYGIIFAVSILAGRFFFHTMTRKEIFFSATIIVAFYMIITIIQFIMGSITGSLAIIFMYLSEASEWSHFIWELLVKLGGTQLHWIGSFFQNLMPYLFVFFGKKE